MRALTGYDDYLTGATAQSRYVATGEATITSKGEHRAQRRPLAYPRHVRRGRGPAPRQPAGRLSPAGGASGAPVLPTAPG